MKRITINKHQVGLVYKRGDYLRLLKAGKHWLNFTEDLVIYNTLQPFNPPQDLNLYLQDAALASELIVVEVKDTEIVLQYENGLLQKVLTAGRYAYWKSVINYAFVRADISVADIDESIPQHVLQHKLVVPFVRTYVVENYEKALLFADGKFRKELAGGTYAWWKNSTPIHVGKVDTRQLQLEINGQEILTRDKAALRINAWAQYKVTDVEKALLQNKDYERQLYVLVQLALREYVAALSFDELLEKKDTLSLQVNAAALGVAVLGCGIRDIILPGDMKDIMNQVLMAEKKAQANIIMRREETASTRSLLNTARLMEDNPMLFKLKEMEYVEKIAEKINNISLSGNNGVIEGLKQIFVSPK
ncbi:slipin family protein [Chitinophaga sp.]|uniref:slipin family protein n=1 Tax=Chitinophaga sp. TaxID=1869181 RepID=UPI0031D63BFE